MTREEIIQKTTHFMTEELEIDQEKIKDTARLKEDMGIDSLDFVDIVVIVEKTFCFKIKPEDLKKVVTFKDFCDYIEQHLNGQQ